MKVFVLFEFVNISTPEEAPQVVSDDGKPHSVDDFKVFAFSNQDQLQMVMRNHDGDTFIITDRLDENGAFVMEADIVYKSRTDEVFGVGSSGTEMDNDRAKKYIDGTIEGVLFRKTVCTRKETSTNGET